MIGHRFRLYPSAEQSEILRKWIGHQRFIYNAKVQEQNYWYSFYKSSLSLVGESYRPDQSYSQFRNKDLTPWLDEVPSQILRNGCYRYMSGYAKFQKGLAKVPTVRKKYGEQSVLITSELFEFDAENKIDCKSHFIHLGNKKFNMGKILFKVNDNKSKTKNGNVYKYNLPKTITITLTPSGQWYLSFNSEEISYSQKGSEFVLRSEEELMYEYALKSNDKKINQNFIVGLDRGVHLPIATSQNKTYALDKVVLDNIPKKEARIKRYQRKLARQKKASENSKNQEKTKQKIGKLRDYINHSRNDFCHKVSHELVSNKKAEVFAFEDLKLKNMVKRPKVKSDEQKSTPENKVYLPNGASAKSGLNKGLHNSQLGKIKQYVTYKAAKENKLVLNVNPAYSSQECSCCGFVDKNNRSSQSRFKCLQCGFEVNADVNASKNIKQRGLTLLQNYIQDISSGKIKSKSKKTVNFRKKSKVENLEQIGVGLAEFKPVEKGALNSSIEENDLNPFCEAGKETRNYKPTALVAGSSLNTRIHI